MPRTLNILLIRLREIGDVVFTTPMPRALKRAFPGARIAYAVESHAAPVVAGNPDVDDVIVLPRVRGWKRIAADLRLAARLRRSHFDLVIDFHGGPRAAWLALATGAPQRIGYRIPGRSWMYTTCVPRPRALRPPGLSRQPLLERLGHIADHGCRRIQAAVGVARGGAPP